SSSVGQGSASTPACLTADRSRHREPNGHRVLAQCDVRMHCMLPWTRGEASDKEAEKTASDESQLIAGDGRTVTRAGQTGAWLPRTATRASPRLTGPRRAAPRPPRDARPGTRPAPRGRRSRVYAGAVDGGVWAAIG